MTKILYKQVRNSSELQFLFEYEDDESNEKSSKKGRLIDKACENDLKKFICHQNTQVIKDVVSYKRS